MVMFIFLAQAPMAVFAFFPMADPVWHIAIRSSSDTQKPEASLAAGLGFFLAAWTEAAMQSTVRKMRILMLLLLMMAWL